MGVAHGPPAEPFADLRVGNVRQDPREFIEGGRGVGGVGGALVGNLPRLVGHQVAGSGVQLSLPRLSGSEPCCVGGAEGADGGTDDVRAEAGAALWAPFALNQAVVSEEFDPSDDGVGGYLVAVFLVPGSGDHLVGDGPAGLAGAAEDLAGAGPFDHGPPAVAPPARYGSVVAVAFEVVAAQDVEQLSVRV